MNLEPFDPKSAIAAARTGDASAIALLIGHYRPYLRLLAHVSLGRKLRSKVDESDIVQESCLLATRDLRTFRGQTEAELAVWLRAVMAHVVANTRRHFGRDRRDVELEKQLRNELDASSEGLARIAGAESSPSHRAARREQAWRLSSHPRNRTRWDGCGL